MTINIYHAAPPPESVTGQILEMVRDNITALSKLSVPRSNPTFGIYEWALPIEVEAYIHRIGKYPHEPVELLVAIDDDADQNTVIGFALFSPVPSHTEACGVNYMAVHRSNRRQGIGRALVEALVARYPHVELTCTVKKVPFYESVGFQVIDSRNTQVVMNTRTKSCTGLMAVINVAPIYESRDGQLLQANLVRQWGEKRFQKAIKDLNRQAAQLEKQARAFVKHRLSNAGKQKPA